MNSTPDSMMTLDELYEEFEFLVDWEDRCDFLIDLGFELPPLPEEEHVEANRVHGCQSNVWMTTEFAGDPGKLEIRADSDSVIVRGLIAVLLMIYSGKTPQEVVDIDARPIFARLGLDRHLSPQRKNGLGGMVDRIRSFAQQHLE